MIEFTAVENGEIVGIVATRGTTLLSDPGGESIVTTWLQRGGRPVDFEDAYDGWTNGYVKARTTPSDAAVVDSLRPVRVGEVTSSVTVAAGSKSGGKNIKDYWTKDPRGLAKWVDKPHPWTSLYNHLKKYMSDDMAKRTASEWYHEVKGHWPAEKQGKK